MLVDSIRGITHFDLLPNRRTAKQGKIARVTISIHQSETPLEKFIFSFYCKDGGAGAPKADILPLHVVQRQARGMLIKLNAIDAQLLPLEDSGECFVSA